MITYIAVCGLCSSAISVAGHERDQRAEVRDDVEHARHDPEHQRELDAQQPQPQRRGDADDPHVDELRDHPPSQRKPDRPEDLRAIFAMRARNEPQESVRVHGGLEREIEAHEQHEHGREHCVERAAANLLMRATNGESCGLLMRRQVSLLRNRCKPGYSVILALSVAIAWGMSRVSSSTCRYTLGAANHTMITETAPSARMLIASAHFIDSCGKTRISHSANVRRKIASSTPANTSSSTYAASQMK
jgi:hypothetical protein